MSKNVLVTFALVSAYSVLPVSAQTLERRIPFVGISGVVSQVPEPYADTDCLPSNELAGGVGAQLAIGLRVSAAWDVQTRYTTSHNSSGACVVFDGGVPVKRYEDDVRGNGLQSLDVQAGYSPPQLRVLRLSAGLGMELQSNSPFLVGGVGIRLGQHTRFVTGVDVMAFRTRYILVEEEYDGFELISRTRTGDGYEHNFSWMFRIGAEIPLVRRAR